MGVSAAQRLRCWIARVNLPDAVPSLVIASVGPALRLYRRSAERTLGQARVHQAEGLELGLDEPGERLALGGKARGAEHVYTPPEPVVPKS